MNVRKLVLQNSIYAFVLTVILAGCLWLSRYSYLLFHTVVEIFCVIIAATIFILAWNTRKTLTNGYLLFIGFGQLFMAVFDITHTLAYKGVQMFPGFDTDLPTQLWIASRYFLAISLLIAPLFLRRTAKPAWIFTAYSIGFLVLTYTVFTDIFPHSFLEGSGLTPFKKISEYVISGIFLAGLIAVVSQRKRFDQLVVRWLVLFFVFNISSELMFTLYSGPTDPYNMIGHLFKVLAYCSLYKAIIETGLKRPYDLLYLDLKRSEQELRSSRDLVQAAYDKMAETNSYLVQAVSERQQAEDEMKLYAARLEQSNRDLEQFAFVASHDLQEPLRKIKLFGERLKTSATDQLDAENLDFLERMVGASQRMQGMIEALLELSRISTTGKPFEPVDLRQLISDVISDLEVRLTRSKGCVEVGELPVIEGDPVQIRQLLQNLIGNALKFAKLELPPVVNVTADAVYQDGHECWAIKVSDNGIGFEAQYSDIIFEPFKRLHGRSDYEGSGIGLAICKKIVARHQGTISAQSIPGEGSTFTILLPCKLIAQ